MNREDDEDMTAAAPAPDSGAAQPSPRPLSDLIQAAIDGGNSLRDLGKAAIDPETGESISWQYFQKLIKNPPASAPNVITVRAIAAALGKSERRVKEAAAEQWLDYRATELAGYGNTARIIMGHVGAMPEQEQKQWLAMIEGYERAKRQD